MEQYKKIAVFCLLKCETIFCQFLEVGLGPIFCHSRFFANYVPDDI